MNTWICCCSSLWSSLIPQPCSHELLGWSDKMKGTNINHSITLIKATFVHVDVTSRKLPEGIYMF